MNPFPHQQRADGSLRPLAATLRGRHREVVALAAPRGLSR